MMKTETKLEVEIIPYREEFKAMLGIINAEWIDKYFEVTARDQKAFDDPKGEILDKGGCIYYAKYGTEIIGSFALEKMTDTQFALTRMGVMAGYQGKRIGQFLMDKALEKSKEL